MKPEKGQSISTTNSARLINPIHIFLTVSTWQKSNPHLSRKVFPNCNVKATKVFVEYRDRQWVISEKSDSPARSTRGIDYQAQEIQYRAAPSKIEWRCFYLCYWVLRETHETQLSLGEKRLWWYVVLWLVDLSPGSDTWIVLSMKVPASTYRTVVL